MNQTTKASFSVKQGKLHPDKLACMLSGMNTIKRAIEICGGAKALADQVGVSQQAVHLWKAGSTQLLARHAVAIERATHGQVTAHEIGTECAGLVECAA